MKAVFSRFIVMAFTNLVDNVFTILDFWAFRMLFLSGLDSNQLFMIFLASSSEKLLFSGSS